MLLAIEAMDFCQKADLIPVSPVAKSLYSQRLESWVWKMPQEALLSWRNGLQLLLRANLP